MGIKDCGYFISLERRFGFWGLRKEHIGDYPSHQSAIDSLREPPSLLPSKYELTTYWGGQMSGFGSTELILDGNGDVFIEGIKCNRYQRYREFVYARAFSVNWFFSKNDRKHYRDILIEFEKERNRR